MSAASTANHIILVLIILVILALYITFPSSSSGPPDPHWPTTVLHIERNEKVVNVAWNTQNNTLIILTRPMQPTEQPETLTVRSYSRYGKSDKELTLLENRD